MIPSKMLKTVLLSTVFVFMIGAVFSQASKSPVLIAIRPENSIIRLDTALWIQKNSHVMLDSGSYLIRAWAPGRKLLQDTLFVNGTSPVLFRKKLERTDEYKKYRRDLSIYNKSKVLSKILPGSLTIGASVYYYLKHQDYKEDADTYLEKTNEYKTKYETLTDLDEINGTYDYYVYYRNRYNESIDKANKVRSRAMIVIPSGIVVTAVLYYVSTRLTRPEYKETPLLSGLGIQYELSGEASGPRVTYNYKF